MYAKFIPTDDPDVVIGVKVRKEKIYLKKLKKELEEIDSEIERLRKSILTVPEDIDGELRSMAEERNEQIAEEIMLLQKRKEFIANLLEKIEVSLNGG